MDQTLFSDFINATQQVFSFLETEYGFEGGEAVVHMPECNIRYVSATTLLSITHEGGGKIWILAAKMNPHGERQPPFYQLDELIKRVSPQRERAIDPFYVFDRRTRADLAANLAAYADFLRNEGSPILRGDFSIFQPEEQLGRSKT